MVVAKNPSNGCVAVLSRTARKELGRPATGRRVTASWKEKGCICCCDSVHVWVSDRRVVVGKVVLEPITNMRLCFFGIAVFIPNVWDDLPIQWDLRNSLEWVNVCVVVTSGKIVPEWNIPIGVCIVIGIRVAHEPFLGDLGQKEQHRLGGSSFSRSNIRCALGYPANAAFDPVVHVLGTDTGDHLACNLSRKSAGQHNEPDAEQCCETKGYQKLCSKRLVP